MSVLGVDVIGYVDEATPVTVCMWRELETEKEYELDLDCVRLFRNRTSRVVEVVDI